MKYVLNKKNSKKKNVVRAKSAIQKTTCHPKKQEFDPHAAMLNIAGNSSANNAGR